MQQILFHIPTPWGGLPIYGFGTMLVVALFLCTWLANRRARQAGVPPEYIQELALWVVIGGIFGARLTFMLQYGQPITQFFRLWEGGLVFYGSLIGGVIGGTAGYFVVIRRHPVIREQQISWRKIADVIAPSVAIGLAVGRIGCLLNGCCYGDVACPDCYAIHFPLSAYPRYELVRDGYQTTAGFTLKEKEDPRSKVDRVEPHSPAAEQGLRDGDQITGVDGMDNKIILEVTGREDALRRWRDEKRRENREIQEIGETDGYLRAVKTFYDNFDLYQQDLKEAGRDLDTRSYDVLWDHLGPNQWPRGQNDLTLAVRHAGEEQAKTLPAFTPWTIGLHPTQIYESISTFLLFLLLTAYFPFKRHDGTVTALFLLLYPIHRFLNELLRNDTGKVAFGMTLSQNGSVLIFLTGVVVLIWSVRRPAEYPPVKLA